MTVASDDANKAENQKTKGIYPFHFKMRSEKIIIENQITLNRSEECGLRSEG